MVYIRDIETGELIEALRLAVILEALVACVQLFTLFPQHFTENRAFDCKLILPGSLIPCLHHVAAISLQIKKN